MSPELIPDPGLRDLQQRFVREILYRDAPDLQSRVVAGDPGPERRLGIYRTNARENFALALEAAFPLLLRCLGGDEFRQLAWSYQRACPSPSGNLFHVGERLPGFMAEHVPPTGSDAYLVDVARLEWLVQEALVAADGAVALDLAALAAVPTERQPEIRVLLHPSVRLLTAGHDVFALWDAMQAGQPLPPVHSGPQLLLVQRAAAGVQLQRVAETDFLWLSAVQAGATLGDAADALPAPARDSLGDLLVRWATAGAVTDFRVDSPQPLESS